MAAAAAAEDAAAETLKRLDAVRQLVLSDANHYSTIITGILPIIGSHAHADVQRWGAEFLAEAFASPLLAVQSKESIGLVCLETLKQLLEVPGQSEGVVKNVIQAAASIYSSVFRYIINNPHESGKWAFMASIKSNILKRWDIAPIGVRVCCIKFVQRVVQVQTPGIIADPRRPEQNEVSLALVPRNHPLIPPPNLEAEASGLLDRLLNVFHEESSDAVLVTGTLNCLSILVRTRQSIANKIVSTVLGFNPLKRANSPMSPKSKVHIKSMERTTRAFLMNIYRRNENGPFAARIKQHVDRLSQIRLEIFDESSRKRPAPSEPTDGLDGAKRQRLGAELTSRPKMPPLPPGPVSVAQLFTLTTEEGLTSFDVTQLPIDLVVKITLPVLQRINQQALDEAINAVRSRHLEVSKMQIQYPIPPAVPAILDEEDDYEPDFEPTEDSEQIENKADVLPSGDSNKGSSNLTLGKFEFPPPPPLTQEQAFTGGKRAAGRLFELIDTLPEARKGPRGGWNRLAGNTHDKESWLRLVMRIAIRGVGTLEDRYFSDLVDNETRANLVAQVREGSLSEHIRERMLRYIIDDFRKRMNTAVSWMHEEFYNDRVLVPLDWRQWKAEDGTPNYDRWVLRVLDGIVPYLDAKDNKLLTRFLSESPPVNEEMLKRVKGLARDPERVTMVVNALLYLVIYKTQAREVSLNALEDLYNNYDSAKMAAAKVLRKFRPEALEAPVVAPGAAAA